MTAVVAEAGAIGTATGCGVAGAGTGTISRGSTGPGEVCGEKIPEVTPRIHRRVASATRRPRCSAVARSLSGTPAPPGVDCAMAPRWLPSRLVSPPSGARPAYVGGRPSPIQTMPCCAANTASCSSVPSLSPLGAAEWVNPAASLSRHPCSAQIALVLSMNALNAADALPMYVGQPKMIASAVMSAS